MKIKFLLLGTSLSFIPILSYAQCVETTNCETLGYTETSCNGGKGVKCPFGNKWACLGVNEEVCMKIACEKLDFKILVQVQDIPVAVVTVAVESIKNAAVKAAINGITIPVKSLVHLLINTHVLEWAILAVQALPVAGNILNVRVQAAMSGKTGVVRNRF